MMVEAPAFSFARSGHLNDFGALFVSRDTLAAQFYFVPGALV
jgi:hypothetical protein